MDPERWSRINEVFFAALERPTAERPAYLQSTCAGDAELRDRGRAAARGGQDRRVAAVARSPPTRRNGRSRPAGATNAR